ncbi:TRAP transporter substrate-binding protein DctP [Hydrogenophaga sp.]|uniref:TRAP transporter substrate-binding protein n=1 Tax=Hydrogenophaga sp. TaxID=1904254 RepID=UPI00198986BE|nr:TRAP transporter substrate-binding protein DctP [Hydrogenophaga sp.]MBD3894188.1 ABC transporter substrate-binding protein [Hydrogenophaga sp.]
MERRSFMSKASVGAAVGATLVAAPAIVQAQPTVRWRCSSGFPKALDTLFGAAEDAAKRISDATGGRFQISVAPAGEIVPMPQAAAAVQAGTVECSHTAAFYYVGQDPTWALGTCVPFGMNFRQHNAWWFEGGGEKLFNDWLAGQNMRYIISGNTGAQMGGWFRKEIRTVEDIRGLKMRIPGLGGRLFAALGAVPQQIAGGDVYAALERGTIDATEWIGPYDDEKLGFHRVARFYYAPGFWEGSAAVGWLVNNRAWGALPPEYRAIFTAAAHEANAGMMAKYDARNPPALRRLIAGGAQMRTWPRPVMDAFFRASRTMHTEIGAGNANFKRIHDHYAAFQRETTSWLRVTENSFDDFMAAALRG